MPDLSSFSESAFQKWLKRNLRDLTYEKQPAKNPQAVLLGGQPGAGKSGLHALIKQQEQGNIIVIDNDIFKQQHPNAKSLVEKYGKDYVQYVTPFSNQMTEALINTLSDRHYNLVIEGTVRTTRVPQQTARQLQEKGYMTSLYVMATPRSQSYLSTIQRYIHMYQLNPQTARPTPKEIHDETVKSLPTNLDALYKQGTFQDIQLYDRSGRQLYSSLIDVESPKTTLEAKLAEVDKLVLRQSIQQIREALEANPQLAEHIKSSYPDIQKALSDDGTMNDLSL